MHVATYKNKNCTENTLIYLRVCPATNPEAHAQPRLYPPRFPLTSSTSPAKLIPFRNFDSYVPGLISFTLIPPAVNSASFQLLVFITSKHISFNELTAVGISPFSKRPLKAMDILFGKMPASISSGTTFSFFLFSSLSINRSLSRNGTISIAINTSLL